MIGNINSIETMGLVDGPGIRVVVFLQGCHLRCKFCHNPETWDLTDTKKLWTAEQLVTFLSHYKEYFKDKGGVTFSGGEPLCQPVFLLECLKLCKKEKIHTCLDTSGFGDCYDEILDYTDLVLLDVKSLNSEDYKKMTGREMDQFKKFLDTCQKKGKKLWLRQVIIPGINDQVEYIYELKEWIKHFHHIERVELLPYHTMGISKYEKLKLPYAFINIPDMDKEKCKRLEELLK